MSDRMYRSLYENSPDALLTVDSGGTVVCANKRTESIFGYTLAELRDRGVPFRDKSALERLLTLQTPMRLELMARDGRLFDLMVTAVPIADDLSNGAHLLLRDFVNVLELSGDFLDHSSEITFGVDADDMIRYVSSSVRQVLGYEPAEVIGQSVRLFDHQDYPSISPTRGAMGRIFTSRVPHKSGGVVWLETVLSGTEHRDGMELVVGISRDVTDSVEADLRLRETQSRYQSLMDHNPDGICVLDMNGRIIEMNRMAGLILGYAPEEILFQDWSRFVSLHVKDGKINSDAMMKGEFVDILMTVRHRHGHNTPVLVKTVPIIQNDDQSGVYFIFRDVTERVRTEELLRKSEKLSALGQLAAGVAHEIRNPLTTLKGFMQLYKIRREFSEEHADIMINELQRIEAITNEMLVLGRPTRPSLKVTDLARILNETVALLEPECHMQSVEIRSRCAEDLGPVRCDENQVKQVFVNVIKNAIDAMRGGGVLSVDMRVEGDWIIIGFRDQGQGIPQDVLAKLGDPFFTTKESGTGLGVMVCNRIMQYHHGELKISSEVGIGTCVELRFPVWK